MAEAVRWWEEMTADGAEDLLARLKTQATARKRSLARIGTTLQLESLTRFVEGAALANVHEVVAAAFALASEPGDSRL